MRYLLTLLLCFSTVLSQAEELPIGDRGPYVCILSTAGNALGLFKKGTLLVQDFSITTARFERKLKRVKKRIKQAKRTGNDFKLNRLKNRKRNIIYVLYDLEDCADGYGFYDPNFDFGDFPDDDFDSFPDPDPTPNNPLPEPDAPNNDLACQVVGDSSGRLNERRYTRIINGKECAVGNSSVVLVDSGGLCTGTVVAARVVITAGHCVEGTNRASIVTSSGTIQSQSVHLHPDYNRSNILENNDVAVIITRSNIPTRINDILASNNLRRNELGIIGGYGLDENGNAEVLKAAPVLIDSFTTGGVTIRYSGLSSEYGNTCNGDSGGPLFVERSGQWVLAGVTSNGIKPNCGAGDISNFANITDPSNISFINGIVPNLIN